MKGFLGSAPGLYWSLLIVGLPLLASWLVDNFGGEKWVVALASLLAAVLVPVLKVLYEGSSASARVVHFWQRSALRRYLV